MIAAAAGVILSVALTPSLALAALEVRHSPLSCIPVDRYARIAARASAPVAHAELQFRTDAAGGWYAARMTAEGEEWVAYLPRPTSATPRVEYRIVMTAPDANSTATAPASVPVDPECQGVARTSVESAIVIAVPAGAPAVPPVPAGFSPAGVVAASQRASSSRKRKLAGAAAGAAVLAATSAGLAGSSSEPDRMGAELPDVRFNGTSPTPGSVLSANRDRFAVVMEVTRSESALVPLIWSVQLRNGTAGRICLTMQGRVTVSRGPSTIELTAPLVATGGGGCGPRFDTDSVRVTIISFASFDNVVYEQTHALPFRFEP